MIVRIPNDLDLDTPQRGNGITLRDMMEKYDPNVVMLTRPHAKVKRFYFGYTEDGQQDFLSVYVAIDEKGIGEIYVNKDHNTKHFNNEFVAALVGLTILDKFENAPCETMREVYQLIDRLEKELPKNA